MKKIAIALLALLLFTALLCGCGFNESQVNRSNADGRMLIAYNDGFSIIYVDTTTGVQYFSKSGSGTCVMVDLDGNPVPFPGFDAKEDRFG